MASNPDIFFSATKADYQEVLFTLLPNPVSSPDRCEISVISVDEATIEGENEEAKRLRRQHNQNRQDRCNNEATLDQAEEDHRNADGRNPRVAPRCMPATPWNLDDDFILECDGQNVFATPSANLATAFKVQRLRKNYSALRAQSSNSRHSTARHQEGDEVNQPDLRTNLGNRDVQPVINHRHHERDEAKWERRCQYDEEYAPINLDDDGTGDLDGFSAFSNRLHGVSWPSTFKPVGIVKFDGNSDPKTWLCTYSIAVRAVNGNNDIMAAYFPVMMSRQALNGLEGFRPGSINSWQELFMAFVNHFQASCPGPKTRWDLGSVTQ
ncbi:hypothetical protein C2845_PM13G05960 [Panicum miliaceum]|uniref:Uncharacterized protein n=1 Tax=Panicum miliaceum TaxID=4540 RepID=A0A3L6RL64_PANMI|nr:hypothetical protein C2845_PM13G05960 [Panicum miliaceum]